MNYFQIIKGFFLTSLCVKRSLVCINSEEKSFSHVVLCQTVEEVTTGVCSFDKALIRGQLSHPVVLYFIASY